LAAGFKGFNWRHLQPRREVHMKRGWNLGWKIGFGIGLLFGILQSLAGQTGGGIAAILVGIGPLLAGAAAISIAFGIAGALVGGVWAAVRR